MHLSNGMDIDTNTSLKRYREEEMEMENQNEEKEEREGDAFTIINDPVKVRERQSDRQRDYSLTPLREGV